MDFDRLQLQEHWHIIFKHRKTVLLAVAALVLPLLVLLLFSKPQYHASIALSVTDDAVTSLLSSDIDVSPDLTVGNYMDILTSQSFAARVIRAVAQNMPQSSWAVKIRNARGDSSAVAQAQRDAMIYLLEHMQTDHRGGNVIRVTVASGDPEEAYQLVKTIGEEFRRQHLETIQQRIDALHDFYGDRLRQTYQRVVEAEERLAEFQRARGIATRTREADRISERIEGFENQIVDLISQRELLAERRRTLEQQIAQLREKAPALATMESQIPRIEELKRRLVNLQSQMLALTALYTDRHPKVQSLKRDIDATLQELRSFAGTPSPDSIKPSDPAIIWHDLYVENLLAEVEYNNVVSKIATLQKLANEYRNRIFEQPPEEQQELLKLQREVTVAQDAHQAMLRTNEKIQSLEAEKVLNVSIIEPAQRPLRPVPRRRPFKMIMGTIISVILGVGLAYLREAIDRSVKRAEEVEKKLGVPVLGHIVDASPSRRHSANLADKLVLLEEPGSDLAENFRALRVNTDLALAEGRGCQIVMVTSPGVGEGKSTIAVNLAASYTLFGKRTLLLDADLYHPTMHLRLGVPHDAGLSNWLAGEIRLESMRNSLTLNGAALDFITTGTRPVTFQKLSISSKMQDLFASLREQYEVIIIDAPPLLPISDPLLLVAEVDLILLALEVGRTPMAAAQQAVTLLRRAKVRALGAVLNRLRLEEQYGPDRYLPSYLMGRQTLLPERTKTSAA
ncbi:MAG: P-loop NTPase [candidate division KSB1 bacterium]|nr:P-loop NTPase [candidate division KSB1 bacterium]MDZ7273639.1 P-loop NTPase [candidate division KSB1 bacterium]MDZ7286770.1 P-loop NTPase [candidate division KSB1 bacterium]MDZ7299873.1 P-loop NTPase [candidate division KSB1 bacterium]MDZ7305810.1 P-loop NTPase [candidate division KSB1 bacterium]